MAASLPRIHHHGYASPAPIFPEEDREAIALENSITFGNFPPPLSYGGYPHPHHHSSSVGGIYASPGRSLNAFGGGLDDDEEVLEVDEGTDDAAARRGRRLNGLPPLLPSQDDVSDWTSGSRPRQRGRSVPHVRTGPDGRESILFGEIHVVLPRPASDNAREEEEASLAEVLVALPREEESVAVAAKDDDGNNRRRSTTTATEEVPSGTRRSIPTLTTSPPTPLKPSTTIVHPTPQSPDVVPFVASPSTVLPPVANGWVLPPPLPASVALPTSPATVPLSIPTSPPLPALSFAGAVRSPNGGPVRKVGAGLRDGIAKLRLSDGPEEVKIAVETKKDRRRERRKSSAATATVS
jgi:hypothetical protein